MELVMQKSVIRAFHAWGQKCRCGEGGSFVCFRMIKRQVWLECRGQRVKIGVL